MNVHELNIVFQEVLSPYFSKRKIEQIKRIYVEDLPLQFPLDKTQTEKLYKDLNEIAAGFPIQYITGKAQFYDLSLKVNTNTLIPRPETEEMVFLLLDHLPDESLNCIDIGTGSGCIALLLKRLRPRLNVLAVDVSVAALEVAEENARRLVLGIVCSEMDIHDENTWPESNFDVIISNPPYIPETERGRMTVNTSHEPSIALFTRKDPMEFYAAICSFAEKKLSNSGVLILECNDKYCREVAGLFAGRFPSRKVEVLSDMQGTERFVMMKEK